MTPLTPRERLIGTVKRQPLDRGFVWQDKDEGDTHLVRDEYGIVKRVWKNKSGMPQFVSFPVANRRDWEDVKPRLAADAPGRLPSDWPERAGKAKQSARPVVFGGMHLCGFFSFLRELCGDEVYCLFYDGSRAYGKDLALHGGADRRELARDRDSIGRELERVCVAWDRGGYIPHVDHAVPPDVPWENFRYYLDRREAMLCGQEG